MHYTAPTRGCGIGPSSPRTNGKWFAETGAGVALTEDGVAADGAKPDRVKHGTIQALS